MRIPLLVRAASQLGVRQDLQQSDGAEGRWLMGGWVRCCTPPIVLRLMRLNQLAR